MAKKSFTEKYGMTTMLFVVWVFGVLLYMIGTLLGEANIPGISVLTRMIIDPDYFFKWYHMVLVGVIGLPVVFYIERDINKR